MSEADAVKYFYSVPEVCSALGGLGRTKIYSYISSGQLKVVKVGARTLITSEELRRFATQLGAGDPNEAA